jgi:amino acid transporter
VPSSRTFQGASPASPSKRYVLSFIPDHDPPVKYLNFATCRRLLLGPPRNPLSAETRRHILLVAFFAWVGLGADGLSSANYGPELGFLALREHSELAIFLAVLTAVTVFVIALSYNQVIELFPTGGGGYKVATKLVGRYAGLVSGSALVIDYVLTIAISVASGVDAMFSLLPIAWQTYKVVAGFTLIFAIMVMNLRDVKESIAVLMPIFLSFLVIHIGLIVYGIAIHAGRLPALVPSAFDDAGVLASQIGWPAVMSLILLAYSLGGGTYTGIEAVSNNIERLAEPRVHTGKVTMMYMAVSLAFTAAGIILLYLIWDAPETPGQTLNAVVFGAIMKDWNIFGWPAGTALLTILLASEAGLLIVAANTGFLGGPAVLSNMAADEWMPHQFTYLSTRLVTKYGILMMGGAAMVLLWVTGGDIRLLVILYSINVFLTFSLSLLGLSIHWIKERPDAWLRKLALSATGFIVCSGILAITIYEKFAEGGFLTILITGLLVFVCIQIKRHYNETHKQIDSVDKLLVVKPAPPVANPPALDRDVSTAAFLVTRSLGTGMHSILWVARLFPGQFKNMVFITAGEVDSQSYGGEQIAEKLSAQVDTTLSYYVNYCHSRGIAATSYKSLGTDVLAQLTDLCEKVVADFPNTVFFASKLIFVHENWWRRMLHNQTATALQRRLHLRGYQMVILPMKLG